MKKILEILTIVLVSYGCTNSDRKIEGFVITNGSFKSCMEKKANPNVFSYQDLFENFNIKLPRDWWLEKSEINNNYGITIVDTTLNQTETRLIAITITNKIKESLFDYLSSEIKSMKKDSIMEIQKIGKYQIDFLESYWIYYGANDNFKSHGILNYLKDDATDRIFIIHSVTFGDKEIENRLCHLQNLVMTFRLNRE